MHQPRDKALRYRIEKWFWLSQIPAVVIIVLVSPDAWQAISLPYVAALSVYALVLSAAAAEQGAKAEAAVKSESPDRSQQEASQKDDQQDTIRARPHPDQ